MVGSSRHSCFSCWGNASWACTRGLAVLRTTSDRCPFVAAHRTPPPPSRPLKLPTAPRPGPSLKQPGPSPFPPSLVLQVANTFTPRRRTEALVGPRFEQTAQQFQPRPLAAIELIAEQPIRLVKSRTAACDGGTLQWTLSGCRAELTTPRLDRRRSSRSPAHLHQPRQGGIQALQLLVRRGRFFRYEYGSLMPGPHQWLAL